MTARCLMIQGTGSDVGKSLVVAGLCRLARRRGLSVAPFKPQNMSNNAAACDGGEIGRAQALQARAAGVEPEVDHNPVLLKPESDRTAQVVVHGRARSTLDAANFLDGRATLMPAVMASFERLAASHDLVIVEGAGSAAETNLRHADIANMGFARRASVPVCLLADIERGGVIANLVGTHAVLEPDDRDLVSGFLINRFRGDPGLFDAGLADIIARTGWPSFGVIPWLPAAALLPAEDAVPEPARQSRDRGKALIVAPMLSRMANFDDADPLRQDPSVDFRFFPPGQPLPRDANLVILFGTKSTLGDLAFLRAQGWDHDIVAHARAGGRVLGLCGGFQLLGKRIDDPLGADGDAGSAEGLGLLDVETRMQDDKTVHRIAGTCATSGLPVTGYEIHCGITHGRDGERPMFELDDRPDGARSANGRIEGSYLHGLFASDRFRAWYLRRFNECATEYDFDAGVEQAIDAVADGLESAVAVDRLFATARVAAVAMETRSIAAERSIAER